MIFNSTNNDAKPPIGLNELWQAVRFLVFIDEGYKNGKTIESVESLLSSAEQLNLAPFCEIQQPLLKQRSLKTMAAVLAFVAISLLQNDNYIRDWNI